MTKRTSLSRSRCTILGGTGNLCGMAVMEDAPHTVCKYHAKRLYDFLLEKYPPRDPTTAELELDRLKRARDHARALDEKAKRLAAAQSVVYYVRIHDYIKIGVTTNVTLRMVQLRVDLDAVMATEPGDYRVESRRHKQFKAERIGRRENFNPSPALLAHIEAIREEHGEPNITTWPLLNESA